MRLYLVYLILRLSEIADSTFVTGRTHMERAGGYGSVYRVVFTETNEYFAVKVIDKDGEKFKNDYAVGDILNEISIHELLGDHPNILRFYGAAESERYIYIFTELCVGGDLLSVMYNIGASSPDEDDERRYGFSENQARKYFYQILQGVQYMHSKNIIHRDIKLENILLTGEGEVKIADFGCAIVQVPGVRINRHCGTKAYMPTEVLRNSKAISSKVDVFSLGVLLYTMLSGRLPFEAGTDITSGYAVEDDHLSPEAAELIGGMMTEWPEYRMSVSEVLAHPWMRSGGEDTKQSGEGDVPITLHNV